MRLKELLGYGAIAAALSVPSVAAAQQRGPGLFEGSYSISSTTTVSVTSPISTTEQRVTRERLVVRPTSGADLVLDVTNERGEQCHLRGNRTADDRFTLLAGQRCTMTDAVRDLRMNLTLRSGSGSISGDRISIQVNWGVATTAAFMNVSGTASQRTAGRRTGGGPAVAAPTPAPAPAPAPVVVAPAPQVAAPVVAPATGMLPIAPLADASSRSRRGSASRASSPVAASPVAPPSAPLASSPVTALSPTPSVAPASTGAAPGWVVTPIDPNTAAGNPLAPSSPVVASPVAPVAPSPSGLHPWVVPSPAPVPGYGLPTNAAPVAAAPTTNWPTNSAWGWGAPSTPTQPAQQAQPVAPLTGQPWSTTRPGNAAPPPSGPAIILGPGATSF
ncbi:MAG: hypothetical protein R3A52_10805 [Polyangiales bacterium]